VSRQSPDDRFVTVNGVRLHYLDWGGSGEVLLFLTALGGTANDVHSLAVHFTDHFHVTRRGRGRSDRPEMGYDTATLTEDIRAFLDVLDIKRVTVIGYSVAGNEETEFATPYPQRVATLVYLDAAYDLAENAELGKHIDLRSPSGDKATRELIARANEYPDYSRIQAPALGVFVTYDEAPKYPAWGEATKKKLLAYWYEYGKAYRREQIERFGRR
jgi:pimeloyl-ACP methyl ester carboxylesterase